MTPTVIISLIVAAVGSGGFGAILTAFGNSKRGASQSETEARAQFTSEFNAVVTAQSDQLARHSKEITDLHVQMVDIRKEHRSAEAYIDHLVIGISNGTIPPIPVREQ